MKNPRNKVLVLLVISCLFSSGCVTPKKVVVHYNLREDLTGDLTVTYYEMRSDEKNLAEQKRDMKEFYEEELRELKERGDFPVYGLKNKRYELLNKTDLSCDVKWTGEFDNFIMSLSFMLDPEVDFEINKSGSRLTIHLLKNFKDKISDVNLELSIKYMGEIMKNNAHEYDEKSHVMKWYLSRVDTSGLNFVLNIRD